MADAFEYDGYDDGFALWGPVAEEQMRVESEQAARESLAKSSSNGAAGAAVPATLLSPPAVGTFQSIFDFLKSSTLAKLALIAGGIYFLHRKGYLKEGQQKENFQ